MCTIAITFINFKKKEHEEIFDDTWLSSEP